MKVALHVTEAVFYRWPAKYWAELIRKLIDRGDEVFVFSDDPYVAVPETVHNFIGVDDDVAKAAISGCDAFVGPPLKFYRMAKKAGLKLVGLLGATFEGEGIRSPMPCAGCLDKLAMPTDCLWSDEYCYMEITPKDVMGAL